MDSSPGTKSGEDPTKTFSIYTVVYREFWTGRKTKKGKGTEDGEGKRDRGRTEGMVTTKVG